MYGYEAVCVCKHVSVYVWMRECTSRWGLISSKVLLMVTWSTWGAMATIRSITDSLKGDIWRRGEGRGERDEEEGKKAKEGDEEEKKR